VGVRPAEGDYEKSLDEGLSYFFYLTKYGMKPDEVDDCPSWLLDRFEIYEAAKAETQERMRYQAEQAARRNENRTQGRR
jgi:hypothetical protein